METKAYEQMVLRLQKPGEDILKTLTPAQAALLHMALGLAAEVGEWLTADSPENFLEETGDELFFVTAVRLYYGIEEPAFPVTWKPMTHSTKFDCEFAGVTCKIADMVKKNIIYNRPWPSEKQEEMQRLVEKWYSVTCSILFYQRPGDAAALMADLRDSNAKKLMTGEKPRYAAGSYSDAAAQTRADKGGAED